MRRLASIAALLLPKCREGEWPVKSDADVRVSVRSNRTIVSTGDLVIRMHAYETLDMTFDRGGRVVSYIVRKPEGVPGALA